MQITDFILTMPRFPLLVVLTTVWDFAVGVLDGPGARPGRLGRAGPRGPQPGAVVAHPWLRRGRPQPRPATTHIIFRQLLPNVAPYIGMNMLLTFTGFVYAQAGLFFLGVVPFTANNWGVMLNQAVTRTGRC